MDFFLNEDQKAIRQAIRELAEAEFAPRSALYNEAHEFPWRNFKLLAENGYLNMHLPEPYGGGLDWVSYAIVIEELARACAVTSVIFEVHCSLHSEAIYHFGSEYLKEKYLPRLTKGELLGAYALTEPGAGSDAAALRTSARRDGDSYVLNGEKTFITNGGQAGLYVVFARTNADPSVGHRGISAFLVESGAESGGQTPAGLNSHSPRSLTPGFSVGKPMNKMGLHASHTTTLHFEECRIPAENLLGQEGEGFKIAMSILDRGRVGIAAQAVGITAAALEESIKYSKERKTFGKPIAEHQAIAFKIADMATDLEAARLMLYRAAFMMGTSAKPTKEVGMWISMAKLFASEIAMKHTTEAVQIHGGYGYIQEYKVERLMREAKITQLYEGTSEIQKMVISRALLRD